MIEKRLTRHQFIESEFGFELEWDSIPPYGVERARDLFRCGEWNRTLVTKIHQISNRIHKSTYQGGADTIKIGRFRQFNGNGFVGNLYGRYKVYVDENVPYNEIWVSREAPTYEIGLGEEDIHEIPTLTFYSQMMDKKKLRGRVRINE